MILIQISFPLLIIANLSWNISKTLVLPKNQLRVVLAIRILTRQLLILSLILFWFLGLNLLVKKLQKRSLHEAIEDTFPFVLNTKQPWRDFRMLRNF